MITRSEVIQRVLKERDRQDTKWGFPQRNTPMEWNSILTEEVGEFAQALNNALLGGDGNLEKALKEAEQVAAVAISIVEHLGNGGVHAFHHGGILASDTQEYREPIVKVKCAFCGEERPQEEMRQRYLVVRHGSNSGKRVVTQRILRWYCGDRACDEQDQMEQDLRNTEGKTNHDK